MENLRTLLNGLLVQNFSSILRCEERALSAAYEGKLSVHEYHLLEAVVAALPQGENTMSCVAARLGVTVGTLTTAVKTLCAKGFLLRQRSLQDGRVVLLLPTPQAVAANEFHQQFHYRIVDNMIDCLEGKQLEALVLALDVLGDWLQTMLLEPTYITQPIEGLEGDD